MLRESARVRSSTSRFFPPRKPPEVLMFRVQSFLTRELIPQVNFRRTDVTAKARVTYFKGKFLEVGRACNTPGSMGADQNEPRPRTERGGTSFPQLAIQHKKWDEWTTCFAVEGVEMPSQPFLGFSAVTGDVSGPSHEFLYLLMDFRNGRLMWTKTKQMRTTSSRSRPRTVSRERLPLQSCFELTSCSLLAVVYHPPSAGSVRRYALLHAPARVSVEEDRLADLDSCVQKPPKRRGIPGAGFFAKVFSLLKWVFLIALVVVGVMAYRGRKATRSAKRF